LGYENVVMGNVLVMYQKLITSIFVALQHILLVLPLRIELLNCSKMYITNYQQTQYNIPEECHLQYFFFVTGIECLTKEALDGSVDFNIGGQIIQTVKYADDLVLLAKEEKVLQGMINKLIEIGRCYGMEMNVGKTKS
jgi:hypothetical protein